METQVWVGNQEPKPGEVDPIKNSDDAPMKKAKGGLWTSTLKTTDDGDISSGWIEWMKSERWCNVQNPQKWVLEPKDDVDVYVIDSLDDAREIMVPDERYRGSSIEEYRIDWAEVFGIREYDGLRLTHRGQIETRFPEDRRFSLYGWDCECTLWEGWQFTDVEYAGEVTIPKSTY